MTLGKEKYLFFLCMATLYCTMTFAQSNFGKYSMQHSTSESELQQYVGQHVKVFKYSPANGIDDSYDAYRFDDMGGITDAIYTIEKIKVGKFIFIDLVSDSGKKVKAKVNYVCQQYCSKRQCWNTICPDEIR